MVCGFLWIFYISQFWEKTFCLLCTTKLFTFSSVSQLRGLPGIHAAEETQDVHSEAREWVSGARHLGDEKPQRNQISRTHAVSAVHLKGEFCNKLVKWWHKFAFRSCQVCFKTGQCKTVGKEFVWLSINFEHVISKQFEGHQSWNYIFQLWNGVLYLFSLHIRQCLK